jgi:hypothetical protein
VGAPDNVCSIARVRTGTVSQLIPRRSNSALLDREAALSQQRGVAAISHPIRGANDREMLTWFFDLCCGEISHAFVAFEVHAFYQRFGARKLEAGGIDEHGKHLFFVARSVAGLFRVQC